MRGKYLFIAFLLALSASCATKVRVRRMEPARFPVGGIVTLAVADFADACFGCGRWADEMSRAVERRLSNEGFFEMKEGAPRTAADGRGGGVWRVWAREYGVDGLLAGTVTDARVRRSFSTRTVTDEDRTRHIPVVRTSAYLEVAVALLDTATGEVRAQESYRERMSRYREGRMHLRDVAYVDDELMRRMIERIARDVAEDFTPHPASDKIRLGEDPACAEGNKLARQGDWDAARQSWRAVIEQDPTNATALYNLGVAAEVAGDFNAAAEYYRRALAIDKKRRYRHAYERARTRIREQRKLHRQMKGRT